MTVSQAQRNRTIKRANHRCEYCLLPEAHVITQYEIDHIISQKHGGTDDENNLAWACLVCNRYKGSDVGAYDLQTGQLVPFFNPRTQDWHEHFELTTDGKIIGLSATGRATVRLFQFNCSESVEMRLLLMQVDLYP